MKTGVVLDLYVVSLRRMSRLKIFRFAGDSLFTYNIPVDNILSIGVLPD